MPVEVFTLPEYLELKKKKLVSLDVHIMSIVEWGAHWLKLSVKKNVSLRYIPYNRAITFDLH